MLLALGFASQHLDFFAHFRVRVERLTTSDDNYTIIGCREGPRQPRSVERFQPPDPAGKEAVEFGSGLRRQRQADRMSTRLNLSHQCGPGVQSSACKKQVNDITSKSGTDKRTSAQLSTITNEQVSNHIT